VNQAKLQAFLARALHDLAAAQSAALVALGDRLGLYRALAGAGPLTPAELARRTGTSERYVAEWLANQACGGYLDYEPAAGTFVLPEEHAEALAREESPSLIAGAFRVAAGLVANQARVAEAFRSGGGVPAESYDGVAEGMERTSRARLGELLQRWIPALAGVAARLDAGAAAADVGCGRGAAVVRLAAAYPRSSFLGIDRQASAIAAARAAAAQAGAANARFEVGDALELAGTGYALVTSFESLHEMSDPQGAARRIHAALGPDGVWLLVEPYASDRLEDDAGAWGRLTSSTSVLHCLPVSAAAGGFGLGARAGERALRELLAHAGFARVSRAVESPYLLVLEARR
jgi:ubiquinone/menaquinone biosynthesis C-methylase UbiE